jgi:hypothetical protein
MWPSLAAVQELHPLSQGDYHLLLRDGVRLKWMVSHGE